MQPAETDDKMMPVPVHMDMRRSVFAWRQVNLENEAAFAVRLWQYNLSVRF
jgi:hypothetical protein